jgi:uncharacterized protein
MPSLECPICRRQVVYKDPSEVPFRPFCSRRCKLVDLGRWLNEEYRVCEEIPQDQSSEDSIPPERADPGD